MPQNVDYEKTKAHYFGPEATLAGLNVLLNLSPQHWFPFYRTRVCYETLQHIIMSTRPQKQFRLLNMTKHWPLHRVADYL